MDYLQTNGKSLHLLHRANTHDHEEQIASTIRWALFGIALLATLMVSLWILAPAI